MPAFLEIDRIRYRKLRYTGGVLVFELHHVGLLYLLVLVEADKERDGVHFLGHFGVKGSKHILIRSLHIQQVLSAWTLSGFFLDLLLLRLLCVFELLFRLVTFDAVLLQVMRVLPCRYYASIHFFGARGVYAV